MKIDAGNAFPAALQRSQPSAAVPKSAVSFTAALAGPTPSGAVTAGQEASQQPDFTSMTRKEMFDWMNGKIKSGEMSLDDSSAFLGMTLRIPVDAAERGAAAGPDDREQVNFMQLARDGISGAISRNDTVTRSMLEAAMQTMRQYQYGRVDQRA